MSIPVSKNRSQNTKEHGFGVDLKNVECDFNPFFDATWSMSGGPTKEFKGKENKNISCRYRYYCSASTKATDPPSPKIECSARLQVDELMGTAEQEYRLISPHSEACKASSKKKFRCSPKTIADAKLMLEAGASPDGVRTVLSKKAGDSGHTRLIPSNMQLADWNNSIKYTDLAHHPTTYHAVANLADGKFLRKYSLFPRFMVFLQLPAQREIARLYGARFMEIDTTYNYLPDGLRFTTIMVDVAGGGFPVAFFIHDNEDTATFRSMWLQHMVKQTPALQPPTTAYMDFAPALLSGTELALGAGTRIHGDRFHFFSLHRLSCHAGSSPWC